MALERLQGALDKIGGFELNPPRYGRFGGGEALPDFLWDVPNRVKAFFQAQA
jgi:hypothetical protein